MMMMMTMMRVVVNLVNSPQPHHQSVPPPASTCQLNPAASAAWISQVRLIQNDANRLRAELQELACFAGIGMKFQEDGCAAFGSFLATV